VVASAAALLLVVSAGGAAVAGALPAPFFSAGGVCSAPAKSMPASTGPLAADRGPFLLRVTAPEAPGTLGAGDDWTRVGGAGVAWAYDSTTYPRGDSIDTTVGCPSSTGAIPWTVELFEIPAPPVTFTGVQRYSSTDGKPSVVAFRAAAGEEYTVELQLTQGAVTLARRTQDEYRTLNPVDPSTAHDFASSGSFPFGYLDGGQTGFISVAPHDGPAAGWQLTVRQLPVRLTDLSTSRPFVTPGTVVRLGYQTSGDAAVDAAVVDAAGNTVRTLASRLDVARGPHTISWDGLSSDGRPVRDGKYQFRVHTSDPAGNEQTATLPLVVDVTGVTAADRAGNRTLDQGTFVVPATPQEEARVGNLTAELFYAHSRSYPITFTDVRILILRAGRAVLEQRVPLERGSQLGPASYGTKTRSVWIRDLDHDGEPEVVLDLYWGGAHCCFVTRVYRYDPRRDTYVASSHVWGDIRERIQDLDHDGKPELISADDRFAYRFTAYAFSGLPVQVWSYARGNFSDITRRFPRLIASDAERQWRYSRLDGSRYHEYAGFLAAWAADEYSLGHATQVERTLDDAGRRGELGGAPAAWIRNLEHFLASTGYR
jgi:hypothetical protein